MHSLLPHALLLLLALISPRASRAADASAFPPDAVALITFKARADLDGRLVYRLTERFDYCQWRGVKCAQGRVVRLALRGSGLRGSLAADSLSRLAQLRVLSLANNSLSGPVPDLSPLYNLKSLLLSQNSFSGEFPPSILSLRRLTVLDLAANNFSGTIPARLASLDRLVSLSLERNRFTGPLPALNQSSLSVLNVSGNKLVGPVPGTLSRFGPGSFADNAGLCGEAVNIPCKLRPPFFESGSAGPERPPLEQSVVMSPDSPARNGKKTGIILGSAVAAAIGLAAVLFVFAVIRARASSEPELGTVKSSGEAGKSTPNRPSLASPLPAESAEIREIREAETRPKAAESGGLVFTAGEAQPYGLEQLMRASAELLGRGTVGTTYKAVLDNQLVVTVKRLDAAAMAVAGGEVFERHMEVVGELRHRNVVAVRAFFQAKGERLVIYDYQPNGSLYNLIHGSRATRAKPLHWTSCLKIAEDAARGLAYIHGASKLVHGNLKSSNVLLGVDFEARLTDYGLTSVTGSVTDNDPDSGGYRAPETHRSGQRENASADVFSFGILLLELLTGKHPSEHPSLSPAEVAGRVVSADDDGQRGMLAEVARTCTVTSPEQRPAMWQVLKMIQKIKESVGTDLNG